MFVFGSGSRRTLPLLGVFPLLELELYVAFIVARAGGE